MYNKGAKMEITEILSRNFSVMSDEYRKFALEKDACRACSVYKNYKQVGQSEGNAKGPAFMFIGEALGRDEVQEVRPFIGRAGQRLRKEMRKHSKVLNRKTTIISNLLACRPKDNKFPSQKYGPYFLTTSRSERKVHAASVVDHCSKRWLFREIKMLKPKIIVTLGSKSLEFVTGNKGITVNRGRWEFLGPFKAWSFATFHPSYVMRCDNDESKSYISDQFNEDIKKIAQTSHYYLSHDPRLKMSEEEWQQEQALDVSINLKFSEPGPLLVPGFDLPGGFDG